MKIYRDYKNLKSEILKFGFLKSLKLRYKVTIYNDNFEKKVMNILNRAFLLANEELTEYRDKIDELADKYEMDGRNEFSAFFELVGCGDLAPFVKYRLYVLDEMKHLFKLKKDDFCSKYRNHLLN